MNKHKEYLQYIEANCLRCHSCRCFHSTSFIGNVCYGELATLLLQNDIGELPKSIFGCHQCGMCLKKCPRKFNAKFFILFFQISSGMKHELFCIKFAWAFFQAHAALMAKEFMFHARAYLEEKNEEFCKCYSSIRVDREDNIFSKLKRENNITFEDALFMDGECPRLFVPGCHMSASFPELTKKVTAYLKEKDMIDGMTSICCGNPLYASGMYEVFEIKELPHIRENSLCCGCGGLVPLYSRDISEEGKELKLADYKKTGSECVVTTCFNCYKGLRPILPIHQYLEDLMEGEQ